MTNIIKIKRSSTSGVIPNNLEDGELAINQADKILFYKDNIGVIRSFNLNNTNNIGYNFIELNLGNTAKYRHQINVVDANITIASIIDISFNYIDEKKDNDIELDFFVFKTISKNGSFDVIITSKNKINKKINLKYKIQ